MDKENVSDRGIEEMIVAKPCRLGMKGEKWPTAQSKSIITQTQPPAAS